MEASRNCSLHLSDSLLKVPCKDHVASISRLQVRILSHLVSIIHELNIIHARLRAESNVRCFKERALKTIPTLLPLEPKFDYVYQLLAGDFATDEIRTLCLLQWSGTKVIGRQDSSPSEATPSVTGSYLLKKGKILFEVTPLTLAELLPHLAWLGSIPTVPVRLSKINRQHALPADFSEVPFETFIICDNLYQGYLQTQNEDLLGSPSHPMLY